MAMSNENPDSLINEIGYYKKAIISRLLRLSGA